MQKWYLSRHPDLVCKHGIVWGVATSRNGVSMQPTVLQQTRSCWRHIRTYCDLHRLQFQHCNLIEDETWHFQYGPESKQPRRRRRRRWRRSRGGRRRRSIRRRRRKRRRNTAISKTWEFLWWHHKCTQCLSLFHLQHISNKCTILCICWLYVVNTCKMHSTHGFKNGYHVLLTNLTARQPGSLYTNTNKVMWSCT